MKSDGDRELRPYKPGEIVPASGVYTAVHVEHRSRHEVIAVQGEEFPACRFCKMDVRFQATRLLPHMTHDFDLAGPQTRALKRRAKAAGGETK